MNAKKIMGAVLVALLAAALFIGAGAAAITADANGDVVFVNEKLSASNYSGIWNGPNGAYTTPTDGGDANYVYFEAAGVYTYAVPNSQDVYTITVKEPSLTILGVADKSTSYAYPFIPGTLYQEATAVNVTVTNVTSANLAYALYITYPNGNEEVVTIDYANNGNIDLVNQYLAGSPAAGEYSFRALYDAAGFVTGTAPEKRATAPVTFTVAKAEGAVTISAAVDTALPTEAIKLTITGQPGIIYNVTYDDYAFKVAPNQFAFVFNNLSDDLSQKGGINFTMPVGGKVEFAVKVNKTTDSSEKITVKAAAGQGIQNAKQASVTIKIAKGTISAKTDAASYFVGDKVKITGSSSAGKIVNLTLEGTNFKNTTLLGTVVAEGDVDLKADNTFEFKLDTADVFDKGKRLDVGVYTLTLKTETNATVPVTIVMKQPFLSFETAPEVIIQGEKAEFVVNAEATDMIAAYVFGTNFFGYDVTEEHPEDEDGEDIENQFLIKFNETETKQIAAGQYFMVVQHPMYDKMLNIKAEYPLIVKVTYIYNETLSREEGMNMYDYSKTELFDVNDRQTANAAQALCDALDSQNIDDMYIKTSFFVVGEDASFTISEIPTTVAQGETFTISGVSTANAGNIVSVEMISTAFAAVPKETVGSAAFILVTTEVAEDGTWEITMDTSDLNVDEYSLKVAVTADGKSSTWKNVNINVVEADEPVTPEQPEEPEQPEQPEEPVAPATPGFGALAALAGLGAVAVLLLRRE